MTRTSHLLILVLALLLGAAGASLAEKAEEETMADGELTVTSVDFAAGERLPKVHAYRPEGENVSPALAWSGVPAGTEEIALIVDDPDAPRADPWVHWVLYGIPADAEGLARGASMVARHPSGPAGAVEGKNDFGDLGWGGPLPPPGHGTHHYHFKLYALDQALGLEPGATKAEVLRAMEGHVLAEAELVGTYSR